MQSLRTMCGWTFAMLRRDGTSWRCVSRRARKARWAVSFRRLRMVADRNRSLTALGARLGPAAAVGPDGDAGGEAPPAPGSAIASRDVLQAARRGEVQQPRCAAVGAGIIAGRTATLFSLSEDRVLAPPAAGS